MKEKWDYILFVLLVKKFKKHKQNFKSIFYNWVLILRVFEKPEFGIAIIYSEILITMYFTAMYSAVTPIGFIFTFIELILFYWIWKVTLK